MKSYLTLILMGLSLSLCGRASTLIKDTDYRVYWYHPVTIEHGVEKSWIEIVSRGTHETLVQRLPIEDIKVNGEFSISQDKDHLELIWRKEKDAEGLTIARSRFQNHWFERSLICDPSLHSQCRTELERFDTKKQISLKLFMH